MLLKICDIVTTLFQAFLIVWACNNIASKDNKISKVKSYVLIVCIFFTVMLFTYSSIHIPLANLLMIAGTLLFTILFYRRSVIDAFLGFGLIYTVALPATYLFVVFYQYVALNLNINICAEFKMVLFVYIPVWIVYFCMYRFRKYLFNACIALKSLRPSLVLVLSICYALIVFDTIRAHIQIQYADLMFKNLLYVVILISFVFMITYFARVNDKLKEVEMLNNALSEKITELKKVKHDYGSEISGLYGLYQLGKMDRIGQLLKSIVERNQALNTAVNVNIQATPMVASLLNSAVSSGVDVVVFDSGDYENLNISDNELLKLLSNIIRNAVDALRGEQNPIIKFKSYNNYSGIVITIVNNGPEIPKEIRSKIFESGFSTKGNNNSDRGYGLSIVKNIIDKCKGKVWVDSSEKWTQFNIEIPYRAS